MALNSGQKGGDPNNLILLGTRKTFTDDSSVSKLLKNEKTFCDSSNRHRLFCV